MHSSKQPLYSITSSAPGEHRRREVEADALAVLRLITSSYLGGEA
jgi:hypothetical protein